MNGLRASWAALSVLVLCAAACSTKPPPTAAFVFVRPEHVEFVCLDPEGSSSSATRPLVLPLDCCAGPTPLNPTEFFEPGARDKVCGEKASPSLHALVTQSTRGEVAAVDQTKRQIRDSDPRIPGYTFVDVGGLPRAIVTPPHKPGTKPGEPAIGPPWTYVASAEGQSLRAVATCRFREGAECGPEAGMAVDDLKIALPAQPQDMVLGPDDALWITLPSISLIARVPLPTDGRAFFERAKDAGAAGDSKDAGDAKDAGDPKDLQDQITFFPVPVVGEAKPLDPVREETEYVSACGLGYSLDLKATGLDLPAAPVAAGTGVASPTRLRFDVKTGRLFVADASQPVIHVVSIESQQVVGAIATGAPIRDFALTEAVPKLAPVDIVKPKGTPKFNADEQRYLYAIDDRDGSVMVQTFAYEAGKITAQPLWLPATRTYKDRLELSSPALAIDIADNRLLSNTFVCDWGRDAVLKESEGKASLITLARTALGSAEDVLKQKTDALAKATKASAKAAEDAKVKAQEALDKAQAKYAKLVAERSILDNAGPAALRGVFALITTLDGYVGVVDVHDLDVFCRGERWCKNNKDLLTVESAVPVAVRRHTLRLFSTADEEFTVSNPASFDDVSCQPGEYEAATRGAVVVTAEQPEQAVDAGSVDASISEAGVSDASIGDASVADAGTPASGMSENEGLVCSVSDPWLNSYAPGWTAQWEGTVYRDFSGRIEIPDTGTAKNQTVLMAASGVDLCARGVVDSNFESSYKGDWLVLVGKPPSYAPSSCKAPEPGNEPHFRIRDASQGRLVLDPKPARGASNFDLKCYPDFTAYEIRAGERFFVFPRTRQSFHSVTAGADGEPEIGGPCVADPTKDAKLVARAKPGQRFRNAFASFTISASAPRDREVLITADPVGSNAPFLSPVFGGTPGQTDSLPVTIRYLDLTGDAYVVDVAQGLRRFPLAPFAADFTPYR